MTGGPIKTNASVNLIHFQYILITTTSQISPFVLNHILSPSQHENHCNSPKLHLHLDTLYDAISCWT